MRKLSRPFGTFAPVLLLVLLMGGSASAESAEGVPSTWQLAERRVDDGTPIAVFVETEKTPGRPTFKIETTFDALPSLAAHALMEDMLNESDLPDGQRRKILEQGDRKALVYTFIDLPFLLADRELALRIVHSDDPETGIHRIDWIEANDVLPAAGEEIVRLSGTNGYWEFRPDGAAGTQATYLSQTEIGGSIPTSIGDRLMKGQAVEAVTRLRGHIEKRRKFAELERAGGVPSVSLGH